MSEQEEIKADHTCEFDCKGCVASGWNQAMTKNQERICELEGQWHHWNDALQKKQDRINDLEAQVKQLQTTDTGTWKSEAFQKIKELEAKLAKTESERLTILGAFEKSNENCKRLESLLAVADEVANVLDRIIIWVGGEFPDLEQSWEKEAKQVLHKYTEARKLEGGRG